MNADRQAYISCLSGLGGLAAFAVALRVHQRLPSASGRNSALTSEAGPFLYLLSTASVVAAVVAVAYGVRALKQLDAAAPRQVKLAAWVGTLAGGAYAGIALALPLVAVALWAIASIWEAI